MAEDRLGEFFKRRNSKRSYPKGSVICHQGDLLDTVYFIDKGMVKVYDLDNSGSERTIAISGRQNVFPIAWLLLNPPPLQLYYYEAFTDIVAYAMPMEDAKNFVSQQPDLLVTLVDMLAKAYVNFEARIRNLERSNIHERLEFVLYLLAVRLGSIHEGVAEINTPITQEDIARLAGVTRESMSIEINKARNRGMVWKEKHKTLINLNRMDTESFPPDFCVIYLTECGGPPD